jgi:hypothetical protein
MTIFDTRTAYDEFVVGDLNAKNFQEGLYIGQLLEDGICRRFPMIMG